MSAMRLSEVAIQSSVIIYIDYPTFSIAIRDIFTQNKRIEVALDESVCTPLPLFAFPVCMHGGYRII